MSSAEAAAVAAHFVCVAAPSAAEADVLAVRLEDALHDRPTTVSEAFVLAPTATVLVSEAEPAAWLVLRGRGDLGAVADVVLNAANLEENQVHWRWNGREEPGIAGPDVDTPPTVGVVAVRHLRDTASARAVLDLLRRTGVEWKENFTGFVAATPFLGADGVTLVNYPRWTTRAAYDAWMAEPRTRSAQHEVGDHEAADPEYHLLAVRAHRRLR